MSTKYGEHHSDSFYRTMAYPLSIAEWESGCRFIPTIGMCELADVAVLARLIAGEENTLEGQLGVGRVLWNRLLTQNDALRPDGVSPRDKFGTSGWRSIVYQNDGVEWQFTPVQPGRTHPDACLKPGDDEAFPVFKTAYDIAEKLVNNEYFDAGEITNQCQFNGYHGKPTELENAFKKPSSEDGRYDKKIASESLFHNNKYYAKNEMYKLAQPGTPNAGDDPGVNQPNNTGILQQNASDLIEFLKAHVGCGYVLGTYGQICTQQLLQNRAVADPANGTAYYLGDCSRWIGKLVADCSGLVEWFLLKRGVTNCDSYSGGMYKNWCSERSTNINTMPKVPGVAVFKRNSNGIYHVGIYVGNDRVIEAKGANYGVVVTSLSGDSVWNAWGIFDWLNHDLKESDTERLPLVSDALTHGPLPGYPNISSDPSEVVSHSGSYSGPLYKKGDTGPKIEMIRRRFWATSSSFVVNEFFDDVLENKIKEFQTTNALTVDGMVGSQTWKKIFPVLQKKTGSQFGAKEMQTLLNYQNYPVGTPDGLFGSGTENVLKAYQAARQLDPDGVCGDKTWESLTLDEPFLNEVVIDQNGDYTAICRMGDSNAKVVQLQRRLSMQYNLAVTGTYDAATNACLIAYQNANGITANGNCGPITWKILFPVLKMGRGTKDEVRPLQALLCYQKHGVLLDGIFGSGSDAAVKAYQTMRGLTSDGIVGEQTWASLTCATPMAGASLYFGTGGSGIGGGTSSSIYRLGDNNAGVRQIKRRMSAENLFSGTVDTVFDATLDYAIKSFQASQGTRIDGLVGPATWSLLFPIVKKQTGQQAGAKAVQTLLNLNGYSVGTPDGLFGSGSETKLIAFQTAKGLTPDGLCGAMTWQKLCEI